MHEDLRNYTHIAEKMSSFCRQNIEPRFYQKLILKELPNMKTKATYMTF